MLPALFIINWCPMVSVFLNGRPDSVMQKMSIADDRMATCGTINLDYRSLYHHFENGCFMVDCPAVDEIKRDFQIIHFHNAVK